MTDTTHRVPTGPAPGYRDSGYYGRSGTLIGVGRNGYSWFSADSGNTGINLDFSSQHLNTNNPNYRGYSFQLRCLSE